MADLLIEEQAFIKVFDPKVSSIQIQFDLNNLNSRSEKLNANFIQKQADPYKAVEGSHAVAILTEWDEFISYDWKRIYDSMQKPAFIFDGRNILNKDKIESIGFVYIPIGS